MISYFLCGNGMHRTTVFDLLISQLRKENIFRAVHCLFGVTISTEWVYAFYFVHKRNSCKLFCTKINHFQQHY